MSTAAAGAPLLAVADLSIHYGRVQALEHVNLEVRAGEVVTLIGANGAGKSTTLRSISRIVPVHRGRIVFDGRDITHARARATSSAWASPRSPRAAACWRARACSTTSCSAPTPAPTPRSRPTSSVSSRAFPRLAERRQPARRHAERRRAADAGDRPRADEPAPPAAAGRALARAGAADRARHLRHHPRPARRRGRPSCSSSRTPAWRCRSRTAPTCWRRGASRSPGPPPSS